MGIEVGNSHVYIKKGEGGGGKREENPVFSLISELINQEQYDGKNPEPCVPQARSYDPVEDQSE